MSRLAVFFLMVAAPALCICLALLGVETLRGNIMGWFLLVLGVAYPAGGLIYYSITRKPFWQPAPPGEAAREETGDRSFWTILPGFLVVFFASPLEWMYLPGWIPRLTWVQFTGLGLVILSVAVHSWARIQLSSQYSGHVAVQAGQRLVQSGPYRFARHPSYTGFLLMMLGVAIGYTSLIGLIAIPVLLLPGLAYRMRVEERLLCEQFGDEYKIYSRKIKKLIPGIW